jgi:crossover junction endodeoxyribonuclease RuvC
MIHIGIDPGLSGAIVAIRGTEVLLCEDVPTFAQDKGREYDIPAMADMLRCVILGRDVLVTLERAQAMPKQGVTSMFNFGRGYGIWLGILGGLGIPYQTVRPCDWTRMLKGLPGKGKERSILFASQYFPDLELTPGRCRKPKDGRADAACLAWYGSQS